MRLSDLIADYVAYRRALGYRFTHEASVLRALCNTVGHYSPSALTSEHVRGYLQQGIVCQDTLARRHRTLVRLDRYLEGRRGIRLPALPSAPHAGTSQFIPYIYSHSELKRLLRATPVACQRPGAVLDPDTLRTALSLLYGAGLRLGEAIRLNVGDVELTQAVLTVRQTKFFKTRLVPLGRDLSHLLRSYRRRCDRDRQPEPSCPFFRCRNGKRIHRSTIERTFRFLCNIARVARTGGPRHQPRLHDLRHTAAVHRLIAWYRRGADLQYLLPRLATYLGHRDLSGTQHYLTLTAPLLHEASKRFERYAGGRPHG
jgi:site-specific recombinase XerD